MCPKCPTNRVLIALVAGAGLVHFSLRGSAQTSIPWYTDLATAVEQSTSSGKPVLLEFSGAGCSYCRLMRTEVLNAPPVEAVLQTLVPVRVDLASSPTLADRFGIDGIPAYVLLAPQGDVIARTVGYHSVRDFTRFLQRASDPATTSQP